MLDFNKILSRVPLMSTVIGKYQNDWKEDKEVGVEGAPKQLGVLNSNHLYRNNSTEINLEATW